MFLSIVKDVNFDMFLAMIAVNQPSTKTGQESLFLEVGINEY